MHFNPMPILKGLFSRGGGAKGPPQALHRFRPHRLYRVKAIVLKKTDTMNNLKWIERSYVAKDKGY